MGIDLKFNVNTWCDEITDIGTDYIKAIACMIVQLLELATPIMRYIEFQIEVILGLIIDNSYATEMLILLLPSFPIFYLLTYLLETL